MRVIPENELESLVGQEVAVSDWIEVTQDRIQQFAQATGDRQWIHLDKEKAAKESPYGETIAHGFLSLALLSAMAESSFRVDGGFRLKLNYGLNRVRFPSAVPAGGRVRGRFTLAKLEAVEGGRQLTWGVLVELEGAEIPCVAAEWVTRAYR
jgi:acyl dehydratase